jgi:penicillin-binding protein 1A
MKQAVGKYCGEFKKPTEPFQSQPFLGHYAREGGKDDEKDSDAQDVSPNSQGVKPGTQGTEDNSRGGDDNGANGGDRKTPEATGDANFDPGAYESPPQGDPNGGTQAPADG